MKEDIEALIEQIKDKLDSFSSLNSRNESLRNEAVELIDRLEEMLGEM